MAETLKVHLVWVYLWYLSTSAYMIWYTKDYDSYLY